MQPLAEVQAEILGLLRPPRPVRRPLAAAAGTVLAEPVVATADVPPFANSAMDGYALRSTDTAGAGPSRPARLRVVGEVAAGALPGRGVGTGEAMRITTGAPVPPGADAVVMVEHTRTGPAAEVWVEVAVAPGANVRPAGGDVRAGSVVFEPGTELRPAHLGVLSSLGLGEVTVASPARVGVLSTGDELWDGPGAPPPGRIRDANRPMLAALLDEAGAEVTDLGICGDDPAHLARRLEGLVGTLDLVVSSGGVSVGERDVVRLALDDLGVLRWWQVAIKPAKPLAVGVLGDLVCFGLPGNPVSAHVSFELFVRPAIRALGGHRHRHRPRLRAVADHDMPRRADGKLHLDRVVVRSEQGRLLATRVWAQASNALAAMAAANGLVLLPDGPGVRRGEEVEVVCLAEPHPEEP